MKGILGFIVFVWIIYAIWYFLFVDTAKDRIESLKYKEVVGTLFEEHQEGLKDSFLYFAKDNGIKINTSLTKSLKNLGATDFKIKELQDRIGVKTMEYSFTYKGYVFSLYADILERHILRSDYPGPVSKLLYVSGIKCTHNGKVNGIDLLTSSEKTTVLATIGALYADSPNKNSLGDLIKYTCPR